MAAILSEWIGRVRQDLEPTPGRMNAALRIVLASVITLVLLMALRMPFASIGMYFVFLACCFVSIGHTLASCAGGVGRCSVDSCHPHR